MALRDSAHSIIGQLLLGIDNTARKQVEADSSSWTSACATSSFTRSLIESSIDALMTTDPVGIITDANRQMETLTGCTRDEVIGAPFKGFFTDPARAEADIPCVLSGSKVTDYELPALARESQETVVSYNATSATATASCRACSPPRAMSSNANVRADAAGKQRRIKAS